MSIQGVTRIGSVFGQRRLAVYGVLGLLFMAEWIVFLLQTGTGLSLRALVQAALSGLIIFSPILIVNRRWRWVLLPIIWIQAGYLLANSIYFRFFSNTIPVAAYSLAGTIGSLVMDSVKAALKWSDAVYIVVPALMTAACCIRPRKIFERKISAAAFWSAIGFTIFLIICCQVLYLRAEYAIWKELRSDSSLKTVFYNSYDIRYNQGMDKLHDMGLPFYLPWSFLSEWAKGKRHIDLKPEQIAEIDAFLARNGSYDLPSHLSFTANKDKNLIFIIVESLNSWMADYKVGDAYLMPNLRRLLNAEGTIANTRMYSQAGYGWSSDGQFIYNTGMLPSRDCVTVETYADNDFLSLAKVLKGYHCVEVICEDPIVWNHTLTTKSYGYDRLYSEKEITAAGHDFKKEGYDKALLTYCANLANNLPKPFFMEITTLSMHSPFPVYGFTIPSFIADNPSMPEIEKKYLGNAWYFDRCLGEFIESLKKSGLYDDTIIVIASDHKYDINSIGALEETGEIVFGALNTSTTLRLDKIAGQIDLFPTVLDIMGVESNWRGIGISMLRPSPEAMEGFKGEIVGDMASDTLDVIKSEWEISDLMLRGNYLSGK